MPAMRTITLYRQWSRSRAVTTNQTKPMTRHQASAAIIVVALYVALYAVELYMRYR